MTQETKITTFADLVEVRTEEMQSMLPGLMTVLTNPRTGNTTTIYSKSVTVAAPKTPSSLHLVAKKKNKQ